MQERVVQDFEASSSCITDSSASLHHLVFFLGVCDPTVFRDTIVTRSCESV